MQVSRESDPRPGMHIPDTPPGYHQLFDHNPWDEDDNSDPEEADIEEHITHGPGGSVFVRQTIRASTPRDGSSRRDRPDPNDPTYVMRDFQNMLGTLMGPGFRAGRPGRSGPEDLYGNRHPFSATGFRMGGSGTPHVVGGRFTFTTGNLRPRTDGPLTGGPPVEDLATYASPSSSPSSSPSPLSSASPNGRSLYLISIRGPPDEIARMLGNIFGQMGPPPDDGRRNAGMGGPPGLQGLFASLLNPANARHGDAVYTQEALDQIISTLMEQHPTSNAPGPANPHAIQALPKRKLDEELLGPEGKGECSVCMDDVHIGDEVVMLPCTHWFHETCASAWLSEHNTCPICRKGIGESPSSSDRSSRAPNSPNSRAEPRARRLSLGSRLSRDNIMNRNEARLDSIRATGRITPPPREEIQHRRRSSHRHDSYLPRDPDEDRPMPGSYRRRESEVSANYNPRERESRRGNTSGSDRSRESRHSSRSTTESATNATGSGGGGPISWLRDRFSSQSNSRRHE